MRSPAIFSLVICLGCPFLSGQEERHLALSSPYGSFVEEGFPFFTQTLDARRVGTPSAENNLTPRGVILKLGGGYFACFDVDLLRVALVWKANEKGEFLTMNGMAPGSYRLPNQKAPPGQSKLPVPIGKAVAATGLHPGWGEKIDRRERKGADPDEPGLGPGPGMNWKGIRIHPSGGCSLHYEVFGVTVEEIWKGPERRVNVAPHQLPDLKIHWHDESSSPVPVSNSASTLVYHYAEQAQSDDRKPSLSFEGRETTSLVKRGSDNGLIIEEVALPLQNRWKRNVRPSAFAFFANGDAAVVTFDGDVWRVTGLSGDLHAVEWQRIASGLHEPIGLEITDDQVFVFDRNGIVRLVDEDGDGITDFYQNFSSLVPQTAETREFANDIVKRPGGGFYLAKGGQVAGTRGGANGTVVEVAADGQSYRILATGLRMPYIGVDPETGMIAASDQQGNWVPATPIRIVRPGEYCGFQPEKFGAKVIHPHPIVEPQIWIPHFVNHSGASLVWLRQSRMGVFNDSLIHLGYNRPEIFKIYLDQSNETLVQGAIAPITHAFPSGLLKGKVNPVDGSLWLTGFKIWGTSAEQIGGFYRVTPGPEKTATPANLLSEARGIYLQFSDPVDPVAALDPRSYSVDRWNYLRSHHYGSGHYQLNGQPGQESLPVASVKLSRDGMAVFLGIPGMKPCHTLRVTYRSLISEEKPSPMPKVFIAYFTIHFLIDRDLTTLGFKDDQVLLEVPEVLFSSETKVEASAALGENTALQFGCLACHAAGKNLPAVASNNSQLTTGPGWNGLWGSKRIFSDGTELNKVDEVYLRESILDPARKVAAGFEASLTGTGMPSYLGVLKDHEIDSLILYIKSLQKVTAQKE